MSTTQHQPPVALSFEAIDDLIYDARTGDLEALKTDIANLSKEHSVPVSSIIESAIDTEDESEGGTGACLLHWPAANGNVEILSYLLTSLPPSSPILNHRNHSGNTPLHWAALNTHLECVKSLVEAGADIDIKNDTGHDAVFLAERTDWSTKENEEEEEKKENEGTEGEGEEEGVGKISKGREVVEWLLGCEKGARLESGIGGEGMEGVEKTGA